MTDPFTSLRRTDDRAELDPAFRAELLAAVRRRLADDSLERGGPDRGFSFPGANGARRACRARPSARSARTVEYARTGRDQPRSATEPRQTSRVGRGRRGGCRRRRRRGRVAVGRRLSQADDEPVTGAPPPATPEEFARGFVEALAGFDADRALSYLSEDAVAAEWGTEEEFGLWLSLLDAVDAKTLNVACEQHGDSASGIVVRCTYDDHMFEVRRDGTRSVQRQLLGSHHP